MAKFCHPPDLHISHYITSQHNKEGEESEGNELEFGFGSVFPTPAIFLLLTSININILLEHMEHVIMMMTDEEEEADENDEVDSLAQ